MRSSNKGKWQNLWPTNKWQKYNKFESASSSTSHGIRWHVVLNVKKIKHPHTGDMLKEVIMNALRQWSLDTNKILMLVTDNGAEIFKKY